MQKNLGRDMSGRTRHTTLEGKGRLIQGNFFTDPPLKGLTTEKNISNKHIKYRRRSLVGTCQEGQDTPNSATCASNISKEAKRKYLEKVWNLFSFIPPRKRIGDVTGQPNEVLLPEEKNIFSSTNVYLILMNIGHSFRCNIKGITFFQLFIFFRQGGTS